MKSLPFTIECKHVVAAMLVVMLLSFAIGFSLYRATTPPSIDSAITTVADKAKTSIQAVGETLGNATHAESSE